MSVHVHGYFKIVDRSEIAFVQELYLAHVDIIGCYWLISVKIALSVYRNNVTMQSHLIETNNSTASVT